MKYIRVASDLHLDHDIKQYHDGLRSNSSLGEMGALWFPEEMDGDNETTFVIPGDFWIERRFATRKFPDGETWLKKLSKKFKYVVFVLGNHDYWKVNLSLEPGKVRSEINDQGLKNVFLLERDSIILDQVKFVGGTLWTDFMNLDAGVLYRAPILMNDYSYIRGKNWEKVKSIHFYEVFEKTKSFIAKHAKRDVENQTVVVVTHMAPSYRSVHQELISHPEHTPYYYSSLDGFIEEIDVDLWLHGHTHGHSDYFIGKCRVICNPRGYMLFNENTNFKPTLRVNID